MPAGVQAAAADEAATQEHDSLLSPEGIAMDTAPDTQEQLFAVSSRVHLNRRADSLEPGL